MRENEQRGREGRVERPGLDEGLARRLDALSRIEAERVLERAIRIQSQKHATEQFTPEQIRRIAAELGVDGTVVDRALREEVATPKPARGSWLVPTTLVDRVVAEGTQAVVAERVKGWMDKEEGMQAVAPVPGGLRWQPDKHWTTATRLAIRSEATKSLRGMPEVVHRQTELGTNEHLVELEVETGRIKHTAWGVGAGVAAAGMVGGAVAAVLGDGSDLVDFAVAAVPGAVLAAGTVVVTARAWASSIRKGMARALSGIAHPELYRRSSRRQHRRFEEKPPRSGFSRLVDEVADAIDDIFD